MTLTRPGHGSHQDGLPPEVERLLLDVIAYEGAAEPTVRALLNLVHPRHPDAPAGVYPAPRSLRVPRHRQRPMSIRLPSASQAGVRGARLTNL
ncbi:MAG TPA: hypothetical protein VFO16_10945 [Pseudonocardiaceae bacterium]|nr:hypothetical protein [Pseudonocardiaceae bacterium]